MGNLGKKFGKTFFSVACASVIMFSSLGIHMQTFVLSSQCHSSRNTIFYLSAFVFCFHLTFALYISGSIFHTISSVHHASITDFNFYAIFLLVKLLFHLILNVPLQLSKFTHFCSWFFVLFCFVCYWIHQWHL